MSLRTHKTLSSLETKLVEVSINRVTPETGDRVDEVSVDSIFYR